MLRDEKEQVDQQSLIGYHLNTFIGTMYGGREDLFEKAKAAGECEYNEDTDKWYTTGHKIETTHKRSRINDGETNYDADTSEAFGSMMLELMDQMGDSGMRTWFKTSKACPKGAQNKRIQNGATATDEDMSNLQECFDSVTRVTIGIKRAASELMKAGGSNQDLVQKGLKLCKEVVPSQTVVEEMIMKSKDEISADEAFNALKASHQPYKNLLDFYNELIVIQKHRERVSKNAIK